MRSGGHIIQQSLTPDAAIIVKQSVSLARRRGHAQVTPLHVATTMLASSATLLRKACLQSHSHPLQCKALELCLNVALNRVPSSGPHSHYPSLSNALVAAFKRAHAHQRRGSIENQQQPILALKIELQHLIISILDDPSVNRVMREAGFSSTQVKTNVEQAVSFDISPPPSDPVPNNNDVSCVLETLANKKRRNSVIVGECLSSTESVIKGVMDKIERRDVIEELRNVKFISIPLFSLKNLSKDDVENKLVELKCLVKSYLVGGVVLYMGDLEWVSEFRADYGEKWRSLYCPVEHMIMEIRRLVSGIGENGRLWLMGIATFQTYMKCKIGHPSLESLWELHPLTIPLGSLSFSLNLDSTLRGHLTNNGDISMNFEGEAPSIDAVSRNDMSTTTTTNSRASKLPPWLQQYKEENRKWNSSDQEEVQVRDLCKNWNSIYSAINQKPHFLGKTLNFSSSSPSSSTSILSNDQCNANSSPTPQRWPVICEPKRFSILENVEEDSESAFKTYSSEKNKPCSTHNSSSSSDPEVEIECFSGSKELNPNSLKVLCTALEKKVPWQSEIIPEIVDTVLQCKAGTMERRNKSGYSDDKKECWLFFLGFDFEGKEKISRELAKLFFGSHSKFISIGLSSFSLTRADSTEDVRSKRTRDELGRSYLERFGDEVCINPRRVFFMEDIEQVDYSSQMGIQKAIESGSIELSNGELVSLKDAIIIFSCESLSSMSRACSPPIRHKPCEHDANDLFDLNITVEDDNQDDHLISDLGIFESVDKHIVFKIQEL